MEKRDLLKEQAEELGRVLGQIIFDLLELKTEKEVFSALKKYNNTLNTEFDIDIDIIINSDIESVQNYVSDANLNNNSIESIVDYLRIMAQNIILTDKNKALKILKRALHLYKILDSKSNTYSYYRVNKEKDINQMINS